MKQLLPLVYGAIVMIIAFITYRPTGVELFTIGLIGMVYGRLEVGDE